MFSMTTPKTTPLDSAYAYCNSISVYVQNRSCKLGTRHFNVQKFDYNLGIGLGNLTKR